MAKKKRIQRKLTDKLKAKIKKEYAKLRLADYEGDALTYLRKVRGAAKGRKSKRDSEANIEGLRIPKDSEAYALIKAMAKAKGVTVKQLLKKYKKEVSELLEDGVLVIQRETEYLISDLKKLPKSNRIYINDNDGFTRIGKEEAILRLQLLLMHCAALTDIFMLIYRVQFKLDGDVRFYCPLKDQYEDLITSEEITDMLDEYEPEIIYIESNRKAEA